MSEVSHELLAVYVDGETKTGKGAAGEAIADALGRQGWNVYYDVAGDFFRRYVALARQDMGLGEDEPLPTGRDLAAAAQRIYESRKPFEKNDNLGNLQRDTISKSVAEFAKLALVQRAGDEWFLEAVRRAVAAKAKIIVLDGRNPRRHVEDVTAGESQLIRTALDLYLTCDAKEAARRVLFGRGNSNPTDKELEIEHNAVLMRRNLDLHRAEKPFLVPETTVPFMPVTDRAEDVVKESWHPRDTAPLPLTVLLDNTRIAKPDMLAAVTDLAITAVQYVPAITAA